MKEDNYTKDLKEWQEKQYQPGEYLGGKFSPIFKYASKKLGILLLVIGTFVILTSIFLIAMGEDKITSILGIIFGNLLIAGGMRKIRNK